MSEYINKNLSEFEMALQTQRAVLRNTLECVMAEIRCTDARIKLLEKIINDTKVVINNAKVISSTTLHE